jgi:hypothetical protein
MRDSVTVALAIVLVIPVVLLYLAIKYWPVTLVVIASLILIGLLE